MVKVVRDVYGEMQATIALEKEPTTGQCHFENPKIQPDGHYWPPTDDSDFCGKFESIPQPGNGSVTH